MTLERHMRREDIQVFKDAARRYQVYILVRRTNPAALAYFKKAGYAPKRLDCKAKTADRNVVLPDLGTKQTAGLVVDPTLPGYFMAFRTVERYQVACKEWAKFAVKLPTQAVTGPNGGGMTYIPGGGLYAVQQDRAHPHYGCILFSSSSLLSAARYVHGDYDLYDIVPKANPARNVIFQGKMLGEAHNRGGHLFDVQHYINRNTGVAAVLHGSQAKYASEHSDEVVDVFFPDGRPVRPCAGKAALERLYRGEFKGRPLFEPA